MGLETYRINRNHSGSLFSLFSCSYCRKDRVHVLALEKSRIRLSRGKNNININNNNNNNKDDDDNDDDDERKKKEQWVHG
jgi:hypothetical protein